MSMTVTMPVSMSMTMVMFAAVVKTLKLWEMSMSVSTAVRCIVSMSVHGLSRTLHCAGGVWPALVHLCCVVMDAGHRSVSLDRVGSRCRVDLWQQSLPPLLCRSRDEHNTTDAPQPSEKNCLLQNSCPGLRHIQQREPAFTKHPPDQDGDDITR